MLIHVKNKLVCEVLGKYSHIELRACLLQVLDMIEALCLVGSNRLDVLVPISSACHLMRGLKASTHGKSSQFLLLLGFLNVFLKVRILVRKIGIGRAGEEFVHSCKSLHVSLS